MKRIKISQHPSSKLSAVRLGLRSSRTWISLSKAGKQSRHASLQLIHTHFCLALKGGGNTEEVRGSDALVRLLVSAGYVHAVTHRYLRLGRLRLLHSGFTGIQVQAQVLQQAALFLHREAESANAETRAASSLAFRQLSQSTAS